MILPDQHGFDARRAKLDAKNGFSALNCFLGVVSIHDHLRIYPDTTVWKVPFSGSASAVLGVQGNELRVHIVCLWPSRAFQSDFVNASSRQRAPAITGDRPASFTGDKRETLAPRDSFDPTAERLTSTHLFAS
jgi:hypothetical protein